MAELPALPTDELIIRSITAVAEYGRQLMAAAGHADAQIIVRENLRAFALAYGELFGHAGAAEFMELMAARQRQFAADDRHTAALIRNRWDPLPAKNVVQFSERYRNRKATP